MTEGMAEELSLKELVHGVVASQKVLTENVALQQAMIHRLSKQQGELLQAMALTPMRHEVWSEPSVRRISTSVSVCVGMCSVVAMQADP